MVAARFVVWIFWVTAMVLAGGVAYAQSYPSKPVQIIAPFPPGGGTDLVMRLLGQKLTDAWGQAVVYDYRSGGAGNIGTILAARARPDGYTLTMQSPPFTINPLYMVNVGYDPIREFAPIILATETSYLVVAHPAVPARSIRRARNGAS